MTGDQIALMPAIVSRIIAFVFTFAIGLTVGQLIPSSTWESRNTTSEIPPVKQTTHHCPH